MISIKTRPVRGEGTTEQRPDIGKLVRQIRQVFEFVGVGGPVNPVIVFQRSIPKVSIAPSVLVHSFILIILVSLCLSFYSYPLPRSPHTILGSNSGIGP